MLDQSIAIHQFLTFSLGREMYAVKVRNIREVLEVVPITRVPGMPPFMNGVLNLRGSVVPVINLRKKFGMESVADTVETSIIIMEIEEGEESHLIGVIVDSVHEVMEIQPENIEPAPEMGLKLDSRFIEGMTQREKGFLVLLDINRVLSSLEVSRVTAISDGLLGAKEHQENSSVDSQQAITL